MTLRVWRVEFDLPGCELSWLVERNPTGGTHWRTLFGGFRCTLCRTWSLGCRDHWFCGLCEPCRMSAEDGADDEEAEPETASG